MSGKGGKSPAAGAEPAVSPGVSPGISEDRLLGGRLLLRQPVEGYRVAIDPVLLAAAVPAAPGERALDLGCGVGAAALCLARRVAGVLVDGLEREPLLVRLARENAALNDLADAVRVFEGDVRTPPVGMRAGALAPERHDHVLCNPPYLERGAATPSPKVLRAAANLESEATLGDWVAAALGMARPGGSVSFIHRADRLDALLAVLADGAGEAVVFPLWPKDGKPAKRVIVRAWKGRAGGYVTAPGLVLHQADGRFTDAAEAVLRHAAALTF
ncbi:MAG: tRNA1(Val) (adenine(37)-N6)-methyltransferase [Kiloniellales bacterium]